MSFLDPFHSDDGLRGIQTPFKKTPVVRLLRAEGII
jgi:hypothetical protein